MQIKGKDKEGLGSQRGENLCWWFSLLRRSPFNFLHVSISSRIIETFKKSETAHSLESLINDKMFSRRSATKGMADTSYCISDHFRSKNNAHLYFKVWIVTRRQKVRSVGIRGANNIPAYCTAADLIVFLHIPITFSSFCYSCIWKLHDSTQIYDHLNSKANNYSIIISLRVLVKQGNRRRLHGGYIIICLKKPWYLIFFSLRPQIIGQFYLV